MEGENAVETYDQEKLQLRVNEHRQILFDNKSVCSELTDRIIYFYLM